MRTLGDLKRRVEAKARAQGPEALAHLAAERTRFRLARQLAEARRRLGFTQAQVAARAGLDQGDVSRIERGLVNASGESLARLAFAVGGELDLKVRRPTRGSTTHAR